MTHAVAVHIPIALGVLGVPVVFVCAVMKMNNATLRWTAFAMYAALALAAFATVWTGQRSFADMPNAITPEARKLFETHQWLAGKVWIFAAVTAVLILACVIKRESFRVAVSMLVLLASVATGLCVGITGHYGGALVYKYGVGVAAAPENPKNGASPQPALSQSKALQDAEPLEPPPNRAGATPPRSKHPRTDASDTGEPIQP